MKTDRPLARLVLTLGLIVLGGVALARLPMEYLPRQSFPELTVTLALDDASDPATVTREWLEEIEGAVRSLGRVEEVGGEVRSNGAGLTVRFAPGTDPERKAARLESELADLRRRLPGNLWITPASEVEGDFFAVIWISGRQASDQDAELAAEELRSIPGVQAVSVYGTLQEEVRVEVRGASLDPGADADAVRAEVERALRAPELGRARIQGRDWPVIVPPRDRIESVPVTLGISPKTGAVPLGSLATVRERWKTPRVRVRFGGKPARALFVWIARGASPLAIDRRSARGWSNSPGVWREGSAGTRPRPCASWPSASAWASSSSCSPPPQPAGGSAAEEAPWRQASRSPRPWPQPPTPSGWPASASM